MLLVASPPALTLAQVRPFLPVPARQLTVPPSQISQRAQATKTPSGTGPDPNAFSPFERLLSRTVFWAYLVLTPPITIASVMIGLLLIEA